MVLCGAFGEREIPELLWAVKNLFSTWKFLLLKSLFEWVNTLVSFLLP